MPPSGESHITNSLVSIKDFSYLNAKQRSKVNAKFLKTKPRECWNMTLSANNSGLAKSCTYIYKARSAIQNCTQNCTHTHLYKNTIHTLQTTYLELCTSHYDYTVSIIKRLPNLYLATGYEPGDAHSTVPNLGATVLQVVLALQRALAQQHSLEQTPHKSCAS